MKVKPTLICTKNYEKFEPYEFNRDVIKVAKLTQSMKKYGFHPGSPIDCRLTPTGMLKIFQGHHRFQVAKTLGLEVYAVVNEGTINPCELEIPANPWNLRDYSVAHSRAGDPNYQRLIDFSRDHKLPMNLCASLLFGDSAGSGNAQKTIKNGNFRVKNESYANKIGIVVDRLREMGIECANQHLFVCALSRISFIPKFDMERFLKKAQSHKWMLTKQPSQQHYTDMIEAVYNRKTQPKDRLAVAIEVQKAMAARIPFKTKEPK
jgi:hypothetical protein